MSYLHLDALTEVNKSELTIGERFVLTALSRFANISHECWPSISTLMQFTGMNRVRIYEFIKHLEARGFIQIEEKLGKKGNIISRKYLMAWYLNEEKSISQQDTPPYPNKIYPLSQKDTPYIGSLKDNKKGSLKAVKEPIKKTKGSWIKEAIEKNKNDYLNNVKDNLDQIQIDWDKIKPLSSEMVNKAIASLDNTIDNSIENLILDKNSNTIIHKGKSQVAIDHEKFFDTYLEYIKDEEKMKEIKNKNQCKGMSAEEIAAFKYADKGHPAKAIGDSVTPKYLEAIWKEVVSYKYPDAFIAGFTMQKLGYLANFIKACTPDNAEKALRTALSNWVGFTNFCKLYDVMKSPVKPQLGFLVKNAEHAVNYSNKGIAFKKDVSITHPKSKDGKGLYG